MRPSYAALLLVLLLPATACDSEPCEEAADKLQACLSAIDCRGQGADPTQPSCTQAQRVQQRVDQLRDAPCAAEIREFADQINKCSLDPGDFCACP